MSAARSLMPAAADQYTAPAMLTESALRDSYLMLAETGGATSVARAIIDLALYDAGKPSRFSQYVQAQWDFWNYDLESERDQEA